MADDLGGREFGRQLAGRSKGHLSGRFPPEGWRAAILDGSIDDRPGLMVPTESVGLPDDSDLRQTREPRTGWFALSDPEQSLPVFRFPLWPVCAVETQ